MEALIAASETARWRAALALLAQSDPSYLPEYHLAYALRVPGARALLWHFSDEGHHFLYPFLLTPVTIGDGPSGCHDISSVYGYTGPLATTADSDFLRRAWLAFGRFEQAHHVVAEFTRFNPFHASQRFAHPHTQVSENRMLAVSELPPTPQELLLKLGAKTRNMLRKAQREGLQWRELEPSSHLGAFRELYAQTMQRNQAPEFFRYDDAYWAQLLRLQAGELRLFAACAGKTMVAAAMAVAHGPVGLYHLGASLPDYARLGAGNLSLFGMSCGLLASGVRLLNMTGGRTRAQDDPLLLFKRSNATGQAVFHIGRRVVDTAAYNALAAAWQQLHGTPASADRLIFWRP